MWRGLVKSTAVGKELERDGKKRQENWWEAPMEQVSNVRGPIRESVSMKEGDVVSFPELLQIKSS